MLVACGAWLAGLGFYFIVLRPPLLAEDVRFMGTTTDHLRSSLPGLERWLSKVFTVTGGFMGGAGVLTMFIARTAIRSRVKGTGLVVALTGVLTVALMSAANFVLQSDFRWILLGPPLLWLSAWLSYTSGSKPG